MTWQELALRKFEDIRTERWGLINPPDDIDIMLADIANLATVLFIFRQMPKTEGFKSYGES